MANRKTEPNCSEKPNNCETDPQTDYERGRQDAWDIAQKVFGSTVTLYEAEDVAKQIDKDTNVRSKESQTKHIGLDTFD